ncbi:glyceraldehyde-3-phosphate dehydrogenase-like [Vulpes lagopus]|uniref:glyceraldehyde-3-phosphate dehydrogenase-like n=1 Tax=Vulpes lagopus TaxID=494514 RepID=UPI001BC9E900|nr:glyceraldehyde-3-phosphate dehydrogenase-like [Vulpes lagopus]
MVKVRVNGFGIGLLPVAKWMLLPSMTPSLTSINYMVCMFQYDSTHSKFNGTVKAKNRKLVINEKPIIIFQKQDPTNIKWSDAGAQYAVESTGVLTTMEKTGVHLKGRAKMVIISAPSAEAPSSWATVHAITATQKSMDSPSGKLWHDIQGCCPGHHPCFYWCYQSCRQGHPELNGKLTGMAFHVPTHNVSVVDLTCYLEKAIKYDNIKKLVK